MVTELSQDPNEKKWLMKKKIIHSLINCSLNINSTLKDEIVIIEYAIGILYNISILASMDECVHLLKFKHKNLRNKLERLGVFATLAYIHYNTITKDIQDFCAKLSMNKFFKRKTLKLTINSIREYLKEKKDLKTLNDNSPNTLEYNAENFKRKYAFPK